MKRTNYTLLGLHFFSILALALLVNAATFYLTHEFCVAFMKWFDGQKPLVKFLIITLTSISLTGVLLIVSYPMQWLRNRVFGRLPMNKFIESTYYFVLLVNLICGLTFVWITLPSSNYWSLVEMLLLSMILIQLNWFFLYEPDEESD